MSNLLPDFEKKRVREEAHIRRGKGYLKKSCVAMNLQRETREDEGKEEEED